MLITWFRTLIFDSECKLVGDPYDNQDIDGAEDTITGVFCCTHDFNSSIGYLLSCGVQEENCNDKEFPNIIDKVGRNQPGCWSLVSRCTLINFQLKCDTVRKEECILIKDEKVEAMLEYSKDKIIMSLYPTDLLILDTWQVVSIIFKL